MAECGWRGRRGLDRWRIVAGMAWNATAGGWRLAGPGVGNGRLPLSHQSGLKRLERATSPNMEDGK